jgi:hypothetical protein
MTESCLKRWKMLVGGALAAILFFLAAPASHAQGTIVVGFNVPADAAFQVGAPVYFDTFVENSSTETMRVNLGHHGKWNYEFTLVKEDGTTASIPPYRKIGPGPKGTITVEPHQKRSRRVVLDDWITLTQPGDYTLKVRLTVLLSSSANISWQKEFFNELQIRVAPHDPDKLKAACEKLAEATLGTKDPDEASDASLALSYVVDPMAVPSMARVLREGSPAARANAVSGLAKIGNREAQDALRAGLATADADLKAKIEFALTQLRPAG